MLYHYMIRLDSLSGGNVTLASSNPFDDPLIDPGALSTEFDILTMVQAMKDVQTFISASPWAGFIIGPFGDLANATTDESKAALARKLAVGLSHPAGTAAMSPLNANWGVVNPDLTLKCATGLRIVDASIFVSEICICSTSSEMLISFLFLFLKPAIPENHRQAVVYTAAERAAHLIQRSWAALFHQCILACIICCRIVDESTAQRYILQVTANFHGQKLRQYPEFRCKEMIFSDYPAKYIESRHQIYRMEGVFLISSF